MRSRSSVPQTDTGYGSHSRQPITSSLAQPSTSRPPTGATLCTCLGPSRRCFLDISRTTSAPCARTRAGRCNGGDGGLPRGETKRYGFRSIIVSDARLTYEAVDAFLRGDGLLEESGDGKYRYELSRAKDAGGEAWELELGGREPEYVIGEDGATGAGVAVPRRPGLIEELMVLANESVAKLPRAKNGAVFGVQRPDQDSMELLERGSPPSGCRPSRRPRTSGRSPRWPSRTR